MQFEISVFFLFFSADWFLMDTAWNIQHDTD
jgi:hypothetical protein